MSAAAPGASGAPAGGRRRVHRCDVPPAGRDRDDAVRLLGVLRPALGADGAGAFLDAASATGYTVALLEADRVGPAAALAGYRILPTSRGRVLFLEDLVVDDAHRRQGAAQTLLTWVADAAARAGCDRVELDTGLLNTRAQALYDRFGMRRAAVHFSLPVR